MCGRVFVKPSKPAERLLADFGLEGLALPNLPNIAPTEPVPVLFYDDAGYHLTPMRWWLHPHWSPDPPSQRYAMFNAKIETVLTSRAYRGPTQHRRAIVPAAGFVEWRTEQGKKQPYYATSSTELLCLAAIWDCWQDQVWSCSIITQPANEAFQEYHDRMPLSLDPEQVKAWLTPEARAEGLLNELRGGSQVDKIERVDTEINNARNKNWTVSV